MDTQAIAARLTAIAARLDQLEQLTGQSTTLGDVRFLLAHVETLTQQVADERLKRIVAEQARTLSLLGRSSEQELREDKLRIALAESQVAAEQAEQQRDAAHAALVRFATHTSECRLRQAMNYTPGDTCTCGLDAALAASAPPAPAQETERGR